MPLSKYDRNFGGKKGSARKAHAAMLEQYGAKKGEQVFYATKNKNSKRRRRSGADDDMIRRFQKRHGTKKRGA